MMNIKSQLILLCSLVKQKPLILPVIILLTCVLSFVGALIAEHGFGIKPCILCVYQRYVMASLIITVSSILVYNQYQTFQKGMSLISFLIIISGLSLSVYHVGVEQHWWQGPEYCSSNVKKIDTSLSAAEKIKAFKEAMSKNTNQIVRCDEVNWKILNVSATIWTCLFYMLLSYMISLYMRISRSI